MPKIVNSHSLHSQSEHTVVTACLQDILYHKLAIIGSKGILNLLAIHICLCSQGDRNSHSDSGPTLPKVKVASSLPPHVPQRLRFELTWLDGVSTKPYVKVDIAIYAWTRVITS